MLVSMVAAVLPAADMVLARPAAWLVAAATGMWFAALWAASRGGAGARSGGNRSG